jgi:hypothetical protein
MSELCKNLYLLDASTACLERMLELCPSNTCKVATLARLCLTVILQSDSARASQAIGEAIKCGARGSDALIVQGLMLVKSGSGKAVKFLNGLESDGDWVEWLHGLLAVQQGDVNAGKARFKKELERQPHLGPYFATLL